jgi:uncharacterized membrane protein YccC
MRLLDRMREDRFLGVRFAVNVFLATLITWLLLRLSTRANPIWAVASMIASSEPVVTQGLKFFRSRLINTMVGCAVGLLFVMTGEPTAWKVPFALAVTVLLSAYVVRIPVMWRQAPITAAIVIAGSLHPSRLTAPELGLQRVAEVVLGCIVGISVSWLMATVWPISGRDAAPKPASP